LSRGLVEAMSGTLTPEGTPGGGLTMTISLPAVAQHSRDGDFPQNSSTTGQHRSEQAETASERS
jgi:two-component system, OmpR family, sensor histidine kinase KdpD